MIEREREKVGLLNNHALGCAYCKAKLCSVQSLVNLSSPVSCQVDDAPKVTRPRNVRRMVS